MELKEKYTIEEIKFFFENKSIQKRKDFIEEYHFDDDYLPYYQNFMINNEVDRDTWYLIGLIELSEDLKIDDERLIDKYINYLSNKRNVYIKLTILDYLMSLSLLANKKTEIEIHLKKQLKTKNNLLKNQLYLNLISLQTSSCGKYKELFFQNLSNTEEEVSLIRVINGLKNYTSCFDSFLSDEILKMIKILKSKKRGEALTHKILELEKIATEIEWYEQ